MEIFMVQFMLQFPELELPLLIVEIFMVLL